MTGKELFEKYAFESELGNAYAQTLFTISAHYGDNKTYKLLEEAEKKGKKLKIVQDNEVMDGDITVVIY